MNHKIKQNLKNIRITALDPSVDKNNKGLNMFYCAQVCLLFTQYVVTLRQAKHIIG